MHCMHLRRFTWSRMPILIVHISQLVRAHMHTHARGVWNHRHLRLGMLMPYYTVYLLLSLISEFSLSRSLHTQICTLRRSKCIRCAGVQMQRCLPRWARVHHLKWGFDYTIISPTIYVLFFKHWISNRHWVSPLWQDIVETIKGLSQITTVGEAIVNSPDGPQPGCVLRAGRPACVESVRACAPAQPP